MIPPLQNRTKVFISYSHKDAGYLQRLQTHLAYEERRGIIERWDDTKISPGGVWREEIAKAIDTAKVAVLLISADFLASKFIVENELPLLLAAAEAEGVIILSVLLKPCRWKSTPLAQFQLVNNFAKPLTAMDGNEREDLWTTVADAIIKAVASESWENTLLHDQHSYTPPVSSAQSPLPSNPFIDLSGSIDAQFLMWRKEHVQKLWDLLRAGGNVSIVGESGKEKLAMLALIEAEAKSKLGANVEVVRLPMLRKMKIADAQLELAIRLSGQGVRSRDLLALLDGKHLILLLDNIGVLGTGKLGLDVRLWLRQLSQDRKLAVIQLVTSSRLPLNVLFKDDESPDFSPLHNVMLETIELGPLTKEEARRYISVKLEGTPFRAEQFEDLLIDACDPLIPQERSHFMLLQNLEKACRDRYDELRISNTQASNHEVS